MQYISWIENKSMKIKIGLIYVMIFRLFGSNVTLSKRFQEKENVYNAKIKCYCLFNY